MTEQNNKCNGKVLSIVAICLSGVAIILSILSLFMCGRCPNMGRSNRGFNCPMMWQDNNHQYDSIPENKFTDQSLRKQKKGKSNNDNISNSQPTPGSMRQSENQSPSYRPDTVTP